MVQHLQELIAGQTGRNLEYRQRGKWDLIQKKRFMKKRLSQSVRNLNNFYLWAHLERSTEQSDELLCKQKQQTVLQKRNTSGPQMNEKILSITSIRKLHIKPTMKYCLTPVRMAVIQKTETNRNSWRYRQWELLIHYWKECKLIQTVQKARNGLIMWSSNSNTAAYPKDMKTQHQRNTSVMC